jgi:drug/metabolite transporter (DMT)-like permease
MNRNVKGAVLSLLGGICWGLSGSVGQYLFQVEGMDSKWLVPLRLGLAGIIMLAWCFFRYGKKVFAPWSNRHDAFFMLVYCIGGIACCQFLYFLTIQLSTAGAATILQDLSPLFILGATCLISKRRPTGKEIQAVILALAGVFLITTHGHLNGGGISSTAILTGIACAFCVMIYNMDFGHLLKKYPVVLLQAWAFFLGGIFFSLVFHSWTIHYVPSVTGWLGIAFVVLVGNVLAFTTYITGVSLIGGNTAILYGFSEPVTAAIVTFLVLKSPFTIADGLGFLLVFLMLVMISLSSKPADQIHERNIKKVRNQPRRHAVKRA